jgi:hypothetical protein
MVIGVAVGAGMIVLLAKGPEPPVGPTLPRIRAVECALQAYHLENGKYPFEDLDAEGGPVAKAFCLDTVVAELVRFGCLTERMADEIRCDGWGNPMVYLLYDRTLEKPTCAYRWIAGVPEGNWKPLVDDILASGAFDVGSGHPVLLSAGPDNRFGTQDDIVSYR